MEREKAVIEIFQQSAVSCNYDKCMAMIAFIYLERIVTDEIWKAIAFEISTSSTLKRFLYSVLLAPKINTGHYNDIIALIAKHNVETNEEKEEKLKIKTKPTGEVVVNALNPFSIRYDLFPYEQLQAEIEVYLQKNMLDQSVEKSGSSNTILKI